MAEKYNNIDDKTEKSISQKQASKGRKATSSKQTNPKKANISRRINTDIHIEASSEPEVINEIGYPVHVYFLELAKMYMNRVSWQWHPEIEILIVNHGKVNFVTNDYKVELDAGQGIVINTNVMHSIEPATEDISCSLYSTVFNPSFLFGYGDVLISDKYMVPVLTNTSFQFLKLTEESEDQSELLEYINGVIADNLVKRFGFELATKAKLCLFWIKLMNVVTPVSTSTKSAKIASLDESRAKDIIVYLEDHYAEKVTLDDVADYVHISKSECCRCFKRALDITPIEYLMKYRILKAATLIQEENPIAKSFSELAFFVGFNNASYFNKVFREFLGCTPSEYKKKIKTDPNFDPFANIKI